LSVLSSVERFTVPADVIDQTVEVLQEIGERGFEAFVLWGGRVEDNGRECTFASAYCPQQRTSQTDDGLLVTVDGDALFRANRAFYERGQILAAQVHSHPTYAYHSDTDDEFPLMTLVGGLSVVIPDFAAGGRSSIDTWMWYRLVSHGRWAEIDPAEMIRLAA